MAQEKETFGSVPVDCPILLVSGEDDPIGNFGKGVCTIRDAYLAEGKTVQMTLYPTDRHEILNETDYETVYDDLRNFMVAHCPAAALQTGAEEA